MEKLKACYKCTCWKHQGATCYTRSKSNCNVLSAGTACGGVHHKLLHGSGVAYCHKVHVEIAKAQSVGHMSKTDDTLVPPDMSQPVLLEVQAISINKVVAKVMFDNGSTAALVTHHFTQRAGLLGQKVAYWLVVVGHERVLRHTILYTLYLQDNNGIKHEVQAYGIDQISQESVTLDLHGVRAVFPRAPKEV